MIQVKIFVGNPEEIECEFNQWFEGIPRARIMNIAMGNVTCSEFVSGSGGVWNNYQRPAITVVYTINKPKNS